MWEQLHCFFFAKGGGEEREGGRGGGRVWREDGLGPLTVGARPEPGGSDDGKPQAMKKQWNCSHTPAKGWAAVASAIKFKIANYYRDKKFVLTKI